MGSLSVRWVRATNRAWLDPHHFEQLFGPGAQATPVWPGVLGEPLAMERVVATGGGTRKVPVRVVAQEGSKGVTRVALTGPALAALELHHAPAFGAANGPGVALSGPRGALVLAGGVCCAGHRLVLPEGVARKLNLDDGMKVETAIMGTGESNDDPLQVEVRAGLREALLVADAPLWDRLGDQGSTVTMRVARFGRA